MDKMKREDIYLIAEHSNWSEAGIDQALQDHVYHDATQWRTFLRMLIVGLGVAFFTLGVLFFFAYNWADLHKFFKLGILQGLTIAMVSVAVFSKYSEMVKNILLTGATMMIGVLFAVFGQVYQTGANAFDFFFGWTMAVTIWVMVANFPTLWLLFTALLNITSVLYLNYYYIFEDEQAYYLFLLLLNTFIVVGMMTAAKFIKGFDYPSWLTKTQSLLILLIITPSLYFNLLHDAYAPWLLAASIIIYTAGIAYGYKTKQTFYIAFIALSIIFLIGAHMLDSLNNIEGLLFIGIYIIVSITLSVKWIMKLNKKWQHGR